MAALIYQYRRHIVNVFTWPSGAAGAPPVTQTLKGYHVVQWVRNGMTWWAVSDLGEGELRGISN